MSADAPVFSRLALIGFGLIGSSIARASLQAGLPTEIRFFDQSESVRKEAEALGFGEQACASPAEAVRGADCVILCTPFSSYAAVARAIAPHLQPDCVFSDTGSTKDGVFPLLRPLLPAHVQILPAHPVAGTENSGVSAGFKELFTDRYCIITPDTDPVPPEMKDGLARLTAFWQALGCTVHRMAPAHHDRVLAMTSHLPHLIAYSIVRTASDLEEALRREQTSGREQDTGKSIVKRADVIRYAAGGFRDFTRVAASDPVMWRDVFIANREAVLEMLGRFVEDLAILQRAIRWQQDDVLLDWFTKTRQIRREIIDKKQDAPDKTEQPGEATDG